MTLSTTHEDVSRAQSLRAFLLLWFFAVFIAGGAFVAASNILMQVAPSEGGVLVGDFGILLTFLGFALIVLEEIVFHTVRRFMRITRLALESSAPEAAPLGPRF